MVSTQTKIKIGQWFVLIGGLFFLTSLSYAQTTDLQPFPHLAAYGSATSGGWPFVGSIEKLGTCSNNPAVTCAVNTDCGSASVRCNNPAYQPSPNAPLNPVELDAYAKFSQAILPPTPLSDGRPDIIPALKARNPNLQILAYVVGHVTWCPNYQGQISYPEGYYYRDYYLAVSGGDTSCTSQSPRFLWNQAGVLWGGSNVNLAYREQQPDGSYKYPVAEAVAEAMYNHSKASKGFNGIFIDIFCRGVLWAESPSDKIDYARAGYGNDNSNPANRTTFDQGWAAGHQRLAEHLRELAVADGHPDYPISANCGQGPAELEPVFNGWMRENYPYQNGGSYFSNMFSYPWGYMHQDYRFRAPQYNYIFTGSEPTTQPYSTYNQQKMRFGLGSASLGNGYHSFEDATAAPSIANDPLWWFDEYGVDVTVAQSDSEFGKAKNDLAYTGWLGQPVSDAYNYILPNNNLELIPANTFDQDINHIYLNAYDGAQATMNRDTSSPAVGSGALHVHVDRIGTDRAAIYLNSDVFQGINGNYYSVTFWAKADKKRSITINGQDIPITDAWKKYQVSYRATATGNAVYQIYVGHETGDVWFDDFHIQAGVGNVYRRDFDHGIILVNPYNVALTVPLEKPYKKILGTVNPTLNNGTVVTSVTLTPYVGQGIGDAIFLLNYDSTPPAIGSVTISGITTTGAVISWTTDEPSTSQVEYGTSSNYGLQTTLNSTMVTSHIVTLSGLIPNTMYYFRALSKDQANNQAASSGSTFTTLPTPNTAPVLDAIGDKKVNEGQQLIFSVRATDPEGDHLSLGANNLPNGATFADNHDGTGVFNWMPVIGQAGVYQPVVSVSDGQLSASQTVHITVSSPASSLPSIIKKKKKRYPIKIPTPTVIPIRTKQVVPVTFSTVVVKSSSIFSSHLSDFIASSYPSWLQTEKESCPTKGSSFICRDFFFSK